MTPTQQTTEALNSLASADPHRAESKNVKIKAFLRVLFVGGLFYLLVSKGLISISLKDTQRALTQSDKIIKAFGILLFGTVLGVLRWQWLLRAQGIHLGLMRTVQLTFIGNFFNVALPGAVSGDFVKAFYVGKEVAGKRARAFGSILFDRVAGLSALVLLSALALASGYADFKQSGLLQSLQILTVAAATCVLFFYTYLFLVRENHDPLLMTLKSLGARYPKSSSILRIYEGLRHYHHERKTVVKVVLLSIFVHLLVGWACLNFAQALGEANIPLLSLYVVVPLGLLVTAIPALPAGMGTGHAAFFYLFKLIGSQRGADVFTLIALTNLFIGAIGGLVYLQFRSKNRV